MKFYTVAWAQFQLVRLQLVVEFCLSVNLEGIGPARLTALAPHQWCGHASLQNKETQWMTQQREACGQHTDAQLSIAAI